MASRVSFPPVFAALVGGTLIGCSTGALDMDDGEGGSADGGALVDDEDLARDVTVAVDLADLGRTLPADFVGLSLEYSLVGSYLGREPAQLNPVFKRLLMNLGSGTLRIGGNSTDTSCWRTAAGDPLPAGCTIEISSNSLRIIARTMQETGWRAVLGVDLNHYSPATALDYARDGVAVAFAGGGLYGLQFGNEPNLYPAQDRRPEDYEQPDFIAEWKAYADAIHGNASTAAMRFLGPAVGSRSPWFELLPSFLAGTADQLGAGVALHDYPLSRCSGETRTVADLLAPEAVEESRARASTSAQAAAVIGAELMIDQSGSISCGGTDGVSNRFASALWGLDYLLTLAEAGASRVDFHSSLGSFFDPIVSSESQLEGKWIYQTRVLPIYYAMLLASRAGGGRLLPAEVAESSFPVAAHAVRAGDGTTLVYLINKSADGAGGAVAVTPNQKRGPATAFALSAPDLEADADDLTLGGKRVDLDNGRIGEPESEAVPVASRAGSYLVDLPPASAVLLVIPAE